MSGNGENRSNEALTAWIQKTVDLLRDVSRDVDRIREEMRTAHAEFRRDNSKEHGEFYQRLHQIELANARNAGAEDVRSNTKSRRWEFWLVVVAAVLGGAVNFYVYWNTEAVLQDRVRDDPARVQREKGS